MGAVRDRSRKRPSDPLALAKLIGDTPSGKTADKKNPAAVELGRLGGLKDGKAIAEKLTAKQRSDIALNAARARYAKKA